MVERRTRHVYGRVHPHRLERLLSACRLHGTTLHGAMSAALLLAQWQMQGDRSRSALSLFSAVDLRRDACPPLPEDGIGCCVSVMDTQHWVDADTDLWQLARECKEQLTEVSRRLSRLPPGVGGGWVPRLALRVGFAESEWSRRFVNTASLSNFGRAPTPIDFGTARLRGLFASTCRRVGDFPVLVHAITVEGTLCLCLSFETPLMSIDGARRLRDGLLDRLAGAVSTPVCLKRPDSLGTAFSS